uniref:Transthyretin-like family protein n=1 Tax=Caenorhabditis tropicalis TaxID=1561998 RepID=A0A1I7TL36_9PELO
MKLWLLQKNVIDVHIFGRITCIGDGADNLHPYLHSDDYPGTIINSVKTNKSGEYHLYTGNLPATLKTVKLSIKHQCRIAELPPIEGCAFPYYTTTTTIYLRSNLISYDFELFEMRFYSTANCSDHGESKLLNCSFENIS